jgi:hypothetical protein
MVLLTLQGFVCWIIICTTFGYNKMVLLIW